MKDGTKIRVCDMTDSHLDNALAMMKRMGNAIQLEAACHFPSFGGEMAQYYAEQEFDRMMEAQPMELAFEHYGEVVRAMELDKERRGFVKRRDALPTFKSSLQRQAQIGDGR